MTNFLSELVLKMALFEMHKTGKVEFSHARFLMEETNLEDEDGDGNMEWCIAFNELEAGQIPNVNAFRSKAKEDIEVLIEDVEEFLHLK